MSVAFTARPVDGAWFDDNVPCTRACPVLTNAGRYVAAIAAGDDALAYDIARLPNPFPSICGRVCAAPCEMACRRGTIDEPIAIRALKRFVCEQHGVESRHGERIRRRGPAGAATERADRDRRCGARWTRVRARPRDVRVPAGRVRSPGTTGRHDGARHPPVPPSPRPHRRRDQGDPGYGRRAAHRGGARSRLLPRSLREDGFAAVFLGIGATRARELQIPGVELDGVLNAVDFLLNANLGYEVDLGDDVVVVGGGNVALDAARTALRDLAGVGETLDGRSLRCRAHGETARCRAGPRVALENRDRDAGARVRDRGSGGRGHRDDRTARAESDRGHGPRHRARDARGCVGLRRERALQPVVRSTGTEHVLDCDSVILAIGQAPDLSWRTDGDVELEPRGTIAIDGETLATSVTGVYAGGDVAFGPRNLIDAIADGRRAAASIYEQLAGEEPRTAVARRTSHAPPDRVVTRGPDARLHASDPRVPVPAEPPERRIGSPGDRARLHAGGGARGGLRCLQCFLNIMLDASICILCGGCVDICPENCIRIVPVEDDRRRRHPTGRRAR